MNSVQTLKTKVFEVCFCLHRAINLAITGILSIKFVFYLQFYASKHAKFAGLEKGVEDKSFRTEQDKARCAVT